jgi:molybdopterin-guanine dinucleotide biosynthesis protein A
MGRDKAAIEIDGVPLVERVLDALRAGGATSVATVGGSAGSVPDHVAGAGPLAGVLGALAWSPCELLVVAPCDLLAPDAAAFAELAAALDVHPAAVAAVPAPDRPLPMALRRSARPGLLAAFERGERSLRGALAPLELLVVPLTADAVADADGPGDLPPSAR